MPPDIARYRALRRRRRAQKRAVSASTLQPTAPSKAQVKREHHVTHAPIAKPRGWTSTVTPASRSTADRYAPLVAAGIEQRLRGRA